MTIRTSAEITFGPGELFRTDRGVSWGVKTTMANGFDFVAVFVKTGQTWELGVYLDESFDASLREYPDMRNWLRVKIIPALNAWLAAKFPAGVAPPPQTRAEEADAMLHGIRITANPDGTLTAS